jgi:hypothetical protein
MKMFKKEREKQSSLAEWEDLLSMLLFFGLFFPSFYSNHRTATAQARTPSRRFRRRRLKHATTIALHKSTSL